jgi:hypothetical protein
MLVNAPPPARWPRRVTVLALAWALLFGAAGCQVFLDTRGPALAKADVIGEWTEPGRGGTLTFLDSGDFHTDDAVPLMMGCGFEPCLPPGLGDGKLPASGTWDIQAPLSDPNGRKQIVEVTIDHVDYAGFDPGVGGYNLYSEWDPNHVIVLSPLYRFADNKPIIYRKK